MNKNSEEPTEDGPSGSRFHIVQPHRDPQSNWEVDLAKNLEEYLLKICSGEITGDEDVEHLSVNFAEAALLLQGSIQVYSRKVEYLYTLVLHALEFISHKRVQDEPQNTSIQAEGSNSQAVFDEENEPFSGLDEVPVEAKNSLDDGCSKDDHLNNFVKPPANLVVLEGDCFDSIGDAGELESYLLSTCDLCEDFILLDPCDAEEIHHFLKRGVAPRSNAARRGSSVRSKTRKSFFLSPSTKYGETAYKSPFKSPFKDKQDANTNRTPGLNCNSVASDKNIYQEPPACNPFENDHCGDEMDNGYLDPGNMSVDDDDDEDDDDPWNPCTPHAPGDLKTKLFKKVKTLGRKMTSSTRRISSMHLPIVKLNGTKSREFTEMWETQLHACGNPLESEASLLYEKLRQSLINGGNDTFNTFTSVEDDEDNEYENDIPDFEHDDCDMPADSFKNVEENNNKLGDDDVHFENTDFGQEDLDPNANLEDLCRSHLDALLASITETENQTELAARVSTWKQRIEHTLEDQDSRPPFDIHEYAERVLGKLSQEADNEVDMSFATVVSGNEKHDVARTFSALLQLVNNGNVDLIRGDSSGQSFCYSAGKPFSLRLLNHERRKRGVQLHSAKKRKKSPVNKERYDGESSLEFTSSLRVSKTNGKFSVKRRKVSAAVRCTPEGKKRRRSASIKPVDLQFPR